MNLLKKKYHQPLQPNQEYLLDKVVMAQAWKKSHAYIRSTNWYADIFELDRSAIDLESKLEQWIQDISTEDFAFSALQLVPAPKSDAWEFVQISPINKEHALIFNEELSHNYNHCWQPKEKKLEEQKTLRPLAHVNIRDQSILTALMMCLANQVETRQGNTATDLKEVHKPKEKHAEKIVNYGNRLYCQFEEGKADFSWGNSTTYSKYFSDYQQFLERPLHFGQDAQQKKMKDERVYEIHLDLAKFYDKVNRIQLVAKINELILSTDELIDTVVTRLLQGFLHWKWDENSPELFAQVCSEKEAIIPSGIPQGLVAGGFFANIYLLDFDKDMASIIGTELEVGIQLIDYCRYVDDMRLIVVVNKSQYPDKISIKNKIEEKLKTKLDELGLELNPEKTRVELFRAKTGGISTKLKEIQNKVSGPMSINEIDEQLGHLEGLISLADSLRNNEAEEDNNNPLAMIENPSHDVREDTMLRFSANKIHTLLQQKRSLVAQEVDDDGNPVPGSWDFLQERMARKFIACWSKDPSQVLLLKKGLEFFPDICLLKPVLSQLMLVLRRDKAAKQQRIAEYCLCEIFRHSATMIHVKERWAFPAHAGIAVFFERLQNFAIEIIEEHKNSNFSLYEQARFFCLVRNDSPLGNDTSDMNFNIITKLVKGYRNISLEMDCSDFIANALLAYQMAKDKTAVVRAINCLLEKAISNQSKTKKTRLKPTDVITFCQTIAAESYELFSKLISDGISNERQWINKSDCKALIERTGFYQAAITGQLNRFNGTDISLLGVIKRQENPFQHENALLKLLLTILSNDFKFEKNIDIANTQINCSNWDGVQNLTIVINIEPEEFKAETDELFPIPEWVSGEHESLYRVGMFLRSCLIGAIDWSGTNLTYVDYSKYHGLKSSFLKRQLSMMHSPEALNGETAPMSSWLSGLLFQLLQWPGVRLHDAYKDWPDEWSLETLKSLIEDRIEYQKALFCNMSGIPGYVERVKLGWDDDKRDLKVVMVQSLLPLKADFTEYGLMLNVPKYRARHRRHVASVAELILHKVFSHNTIDDEKYKKAKVDLIVWPELAVNNDDIDILKRLSDKTGAIIFAGLTFTHLTGFKGPNNVAKWIIPTKQKSGRQFISRLQGKQNMTKDEVGKVEPWRPYQLFIELMHPGFPTQRGFRLTGSICYDATDINLSADLKGKSDAYLISALNQDVNTFDSMVDALYYHIYQHVVLVNTGEFGGSVAKAPYKERHEKLITHVHGSHQVSISNFEMNMFDFRHIGNPYCSGKKVKTRPAGENHF